MAYRDDITALGASHLYPCDSNLNDIVGTLNFTNSGGAFNGPQICEDTTASYVLNSTTDTATAASDPAFQSAVVDYCFSFWFRTTAVQLPPCRVFGDGGQVSSNSICLGFGNTALSEVFSNPDVSQVGSISDIVPNRAYHLTLIFRDLGSGNSQLEFFIDGVSQGTKTVADTSGTNRGGFRIGGVTGTTTYSIGGVPFQLVSPVDGQYAMVSTFVSTNVPTSTEVREELFEKGALPHVTISSDTESNMQTALNALSSTTRPNVPLAIRIEALSGGGDLSLNLSSVTFDANSSIHIQYMGTDTLTIVNAGSNASIGSTPNGGTITFIDQVSIDITARDVEDNSLITPARVYLVAAAGGPLAEGTLIANQETVSGVMSTIFNYTSDQPFTGRVRKGSASPFYATSSISGTITSDGFATTVLMIPDE